MELELWKVMQIDVRVSDHEKSYFDEALKSYEKLITVKYIKPNTEDTELYTLVSKNVVNFLYLGMAFQFQIMKDVRDTDIKIIQEQYKIIESLKKQKNDKLWQDSEEDSEEKEDLDVLKEDVHSKKEVKD